VIRRRAGAEGPPRCALHDRLLVVAVLPSGETTRRCRACSRARLVEMGETVEGVPIVAVLPPVRAPHEPPPCPRCCEPLGLAAAGFCATCGYPGDAVNAEQQRRELRRRRRREARAASAR
jgi:hypothetical protein